MDRGLGRLVASGKPAIVYAPLRHTLSSGGKRLRALLVLLGCNAVGGSDASALPAAVALECLHNFTLIHDDVMDRSPVRRSRPTVHAKWGDAVAVLAGDHLLSLGYQSLHGSARNPAGDRAIGRLDRLDRLARILEVYTRAYRDVCEGQGFDLEFERRREVSMREYTKMIGLKTACVIAAASEIGALAGGGRPAEVRSLRLYGERIGLAFQIRDDELDVTGDPKEFGKKIGGDIARAKKTYLLVKAMETARGTDAALLRSVATARGARPVAKVRSVYERTGAIGAARREIVKLTRAAKYALGSLPESAGKSILIDIAERLAGRTA